jgi:hypothetical protein
MKAEGAMRWALDEVMGNPYSDVPPRMEEYTSSTLPTTETETKTSVRWDDAETLPHDGVDVG